MLCFPLQMIRNLKNGLSEDGQVQLVEGDSEGMSTSAYCPVAALASCFTLQSYRTILLFLFSFLFEVVGEFMWCGVNLCPDCKW